MWTLLIRLGTVLSTVMIAKQFVDRFWPNEIQPTRLYRLNQIARYLGTSPPRVLDLIRQGHLPAKWVDQQPRVLGSSVLQFLSQQT